MSEYENVKQAGSGEASPEKNAAPYISVGFDCMERYGYAAYRSGLLPVSSIRVRNDSDKIITVSGRLTSMPSFFKYYDFRAEGILPGTSFIIDAPEILPDAAALAFLQSDTAVRYTLEAVSDKGDDPKLRAVKSEQTHFLTSMDSWGGVRSYPELLASFVDPGCDCVKACADKVRKKNPRLFAADGYAGKSPDEIRGIFSDVYTEVKRLGIRYSTKVFYPDKKGTVISFPEMTVYKKLGSSFEIALVIASILEALGLNVIVSVWAGATLVGCFSEDMTLSRAVSGSFDELEYMVGRDLIMLCDASSAVDGINVSFASSCLKARSLFERRDLFYISADISKCRALGVEPLPKRRVTENGTEFGRPEKVSDDSETAKHYDDLSASADVFKGDDPAKDAEDKAYRLFGILSRTDKALRARIVAHPEDILKEAFASGTGGEIRFFRTDSFGELKNNIIRRRTSPDDLSDKHVLITSSPAKEIYRRASDCEKRKYFGTGRDSLYFTFCEITYYDPERRKQFTSPMCLVPASVSGYSGNDLVISFPYHGFYTNDILADRLGTLYGVDLSGIKDFENVPDGGDVIFAVRGAVNSIKDICEDFLLQEKLRLDEKTCCFEIADYSPAYSLRFDLENMPEAAKKAAECAVNGPAFDEAVISAALSDAKLSDDLLSAIIKKKKTARSPAGFIPQAGFFPDAPEGVIPEEFLPQLLMMGTDERAAAIRSAMGSDVFAKGASRRAREDFALRCAELAILRGEDVVYVSSSRGAALSFIGRIKECAGGVKLKNLTDNVSPYISPDVAEMIRTGDFSYEGAEMPVFRTAAEAVEKAEKYLKEISASAGSPGIVSYESGSASAATERPALTSGGGAIYDLDEMSLLRDIKNRKDVYDSLFAALTKKYSFGVSYLTACRRYHSVKKSVPDASFSIGTLCGVLGGADAKYEKTLCDRAMKNVFERVSDYIVTAADVKEKFIESFPSCGNDVLSATALNRFAPDISDGKTAEGLAKLCREYSDSCRSYVEAASAVVSSLGIASPSAEEMTEERAERIYRLALAISKENAGDAVCKYLRGEAPAVSDRDFAEIEDAAEDARNARALRDGILTDFTDDVFSVDTERIAIDYEYKTGGGFFSKTAAKRNLLKAMKPYAREGEKLTADRAADAVYTIAKIEALENASEVGLAIVKRIFGASAVSGSDRAEIWQNAEKTCSLAHAASKKAADLIKGAFPEDGPEKLPERASVIEGLIKEENAHASLAELCDTYENAKSELEKKENILFELLRAECDPFGGAEKRTLGDLVSFSGLLSLHSPLIADWCVYASARKSALECGADGVVALFEKGELDTSNAADSFVKGFYGSACGFIKEHDSVLRSYNEKSFGASANTLLDLCEKWERDEIGRIFSGRMKTDGEKLGRLFVTTFDAPIRGLSGDSRAALGVIDCSDREFTLRALPAFSQFKRFVFVSGNEKTAFFPSRFDPVSSSSGIYERSAPLGTTLMYDMESSFGEYFALSSPLARDGDCDDDIRYILSKPAFELCRTDGVSAVREKDCRPDLAASGEIYPFMPYLAMPFDFFTSEDEAKRVVEKVREAVTEGLSVSVCSAASAQARRISALCGEDPAIKKAVSSGAVIYNDVMDLTKPGNVFNRDADVIIISTVLSISSNSKEPVSLIPMGGTLSAKRDLYAELERTGARKVVIVTSLKKELIGRTLVSDDFEALRRLIYTASFADGGNLSGRLSRPSAKPRRETSCGAGLLMEKAVKDGYDVFPAFSPSSGVTFDFAAVKDGSLLCVMTAETELRGGRLLRTGKRVERKLNRIN